MELSAVSFAITRVSLRDSEQLQAVVDATRTELLQTRGGCRRFERPV
jgi:hypothetical protein